MSVTIFPKLSVSLAITCFDCFALKSGRPGDSSEIVVVPCRLRLLRGATLLREISRKGLLGDVS